MTTLERLEGALTGLAALDTEGFTLEGARDFEAQTLLCVSSVRAMTEGRPAGFYARAARDIRALVTQGRLTIGHTLMTVATTPGYVENPFRASEAVATLHAVQDSDDTALARIAAVAGAPDGYFAEPITRVFEKTAHLTHAKPFDIGACVLYGLLLREALIKSDVPDKKTLVSFARDYDLALTDTILEAYRLKGQVFAPERPGTMQVSVRIIFANAFARASWEDVLSLKVACPALGAWAGALYGVKAGLISKARSKKLSLTALALARTFAGQNALR